MVKAVRLFAPSSFLLLLAVDVICFVAAFYAAATFTLYIDASVFMIEEGGAVRLLPTAIILLFSLYFAGLYSRTRAGSRIYLMQQLSLVAGIALVSQAFIGYIDSDWIIPRWTMLTGTAGTIAAIFASRLIYYAMAARFTGRRGILLVGSDRTLHRIAQHIRQNINLDYSVAGTLSPNTEGAVPPVIGGVAEIETAVREFAPHMIVTGFASRNELAPTPELLKLRFAGKTVEEAGTAFETICRRVSARDLRPSRVLFTQDFDPRPEALFVLAMDRLVALVFLTIGAVPVLLVTMWVKTQAGRSALLRETCAGYRGRPFTSLRFYIPPGGPLARVARSVKLAIYPQLWNVLTGRMSLVGPRPQRAELAVEFSRFIPVYDLRQSVRPGIIGWSQLHNSTQQIVEILEEIEYDLYYVKNHCSSLYLFVLLHGLRTA